STSRGGCRGQRRAAESAPPPRTRSGGGYGISWDEVYRSVLIHGPPRDPAAHDCGGTRVDERREAGRPRRQQILGGPATIGRHARQRHDITPVLAGSERGAEVVGRAARGHGMCEGGQTPCQLTRGRIATGVQNPVLPG